MIKIQKSFFKIFFSFFLINSSLLLANDIHTTEKLLDLDKFEFVPSLSKNKFQKFQLNENIIMGTNLEKNINSDGITTFYGNRIVLELIKDDDFTIIQNVKFFCCQKITLKFSNDIGKEIVFNLEQNHNISQLKIIKVGNNIDFYSGNVLILRDVTNKLKEIQKLKYIDIIYGTTLYNVLVLK